MVASLTAYAEFVFAQVQDSVEEVENSGFLATASTLDVKLMANNKILQVRIVTASNLRLPVPCGTPPRCRGADARNGDCSILPRCCNTLLARKRLENETDETSALPCLLPPRCTRTACASS